MKEFEGALISLGEKRKNKVLCLKGLIEFSILKRDDDYEFYSYTMDDSLCSVFYDCASEQYCIEPKKDKLVYLKSGQPLGKGKQYHLPRGLIFYISNQENMFKLA